MENFHSQLDTFRTAILTNLVASKGINVSFPTYKGEIKINEFGVAMYYNSELVDGYTPLYNLSTDEMIDLLSYLD